MAYGFGVDYSDQTLDHMPDFKKMVDGCVTEARSVVYIGWRPHDSGYNFFEWLIKFGYCKDGPMLTLVVEAWQPNVDAFREPYETCFKVCARAEDLLELVPPWMRDCIVWLDGPEHLYNENAERLIKSWQLLGFKSIVLSTPDGYLEQGPLDGNEYERHLGIWTKKTYKELNFAVESYSAGLIGCWRKK